MSDTDESHCRLCAEPTSMEQLISTDDDVGLNSKIKTKMLWINVDVSITNSLPKTICFSCFDLLERSWAFLHNVQTAQIKLSSIYLKESDVGSKSISEVNNAGRPVNTDWEQFQNPKPSIKSEENDEDGSKYEIPDMEPCIKLEPHDSDNFDYINDTDSDVPLAVKKKKVKTKKKTKTRHKTSLKDVLDFSMYNMTWTNFIWCCASCDAQCKSLDSLRLHSLEIHSQCCHYKCADCNKTMTNHKTFINHIKVHYKSLRELCDLCGLNFGNSTLVKKHKLDVHSDITPYICIACGFCFDSKDQLSLHLEQYSKDVRRHDKTEKNILEEDLKCEVCNREFKSRGNLLTHKQVHTQRIRNFSCDKCGKMFYTKGALSTHLSTHEDSKPFKCEFCPLAFRARGNLTSHISLHSAAKPFVCEQCGKSFRVKRHLKSHSIVHTDLMPYSCEYCNKQFRFKTRLNLHVRQHTGAKPYSCMFCRRDFTNGSNYKKHMNRRHQIDTSVRMKYNTASLNNDEDNNDVKVINASSS